MSTPVLSLNKARGIAHTLLHSSPHGRDEMRATLAKARDILTAALDADAAGTSPTDDAPPV